MATAQKTGNPPPKHKAGNPAPETLSITEQEPVQTGDVWDFLVNSLDTMRQHAIGMRDTQRQMQQMISHSFGSIGGSGFVNNGQSRPALPAPQSVQTDSAPATAAAPPPKHRPATAAAPVTAPAAAVTNASPEEGKPKKVTPGERNYENDMSLVEAVYQVLDRPEHADGLRVGEIVDVIEKEKKWQSASDDISNMVQGAVYKLKEKGKVVRGESRKYYIPEGSTPPEGRKSGSKAEGEE